MKRWLPVVVGVAAAVLFARLGIWQLHRLAERKVRNAMIQHRLGAPPVPPDRDTIPFRAATARGVFDFAHQQIVMLRSRDGVPGVEIATPLATENGVRVLVLRGWVPSPDGKTVDLARLGEPERAAVTGYLAAPLENPAASDTAWPRYVRRPDPGLVRSPAAPLVLERTVLPPGAPRGMQPMRPPRLTNGPHLSYAIQWFSFAAIAVVGGTILAVRGGETSDERRRDDGRTTSGG